MATARQVKLAQEEVGYRPAEGAPNCAMCTHFIPGASPDAPGECDLVDGAIEPTAVCDLFEDSTGEQQLAADAPASVMY